jgi:hypothetical protein
MMDCREEDAPISVDLFPSPPFSRLIVFRTVTSLNHLNALPHTTCCSLVGLPLARLFPLHRSCSTISMGFRGTSNSRTLRNCDHKTLLSRCLFPSTAYQLHKCVVLAVLQYHQSAMRLPRKIDIIFSHQFRIQIYIKMRCNLPRLQILTWEVGLGPVWLSFVETYSRVGLFRISPLLS